jgi:hypothetical protein
MTAATGIVLKTKSDACVASRPRGPSEPILQLYDENASAEQLALPAPYSEVARVADRVMKALLEILSQVLADERKDADGRFAEFDAKLGKLQRENVELRGKIADLTHQLKLDRATRGITDGASLPASLVRRSNGAARAVPAKRQRPAPLTGNARAVAKI